MNRRTVWLLVADEAIARILALPGPQPVEELTDPAAHASGRELRRDAFGRRNDTATASAGLDAEHREAAQFARRVAQHLHDALQQRRFDELRIAAAPRFLGLLRKALSPQVQATVASELSKDLVHLGAGEIGERFFPP